ncbi:hypothetical protein OESDEN_17229 [Oesophagostomum dentatum]|uniref:Uncharacterized protein n=1 Tax=Oesophagostomum dentatum TaxID=61180 RepID=A0A0B1SIP7_OESDE|nr:hypothetical protein OESDEN_17229 [Oesophagostomum dentatum]
MLSRTAYIRCRLQNAQCISEFFKSHEDSALLYFGHCTKLLRVLGESGLKDMNTPFIVKRKHSEKCLRGPPKRAAAREKEWIFPE